MPDAYQCLPGQTTDATGVLRLDPDLTLSIPPDPANTDWRAYEAWKGEGNAPLPGDPTPLTTFAAGLISADVRTTDAQPTELYRMTLPSLTGVACDLVLIGVDTGNGACRILRSSYAAKRLNAGAVGIPQAQITYANHQDTGASSWAIAPSIDGNDLVLSVTGAVGRTIDWSLSGAITTFTPSGR